MLLEKLAEYGFYIILAIMLGVFIFNASQTPMLGEDEPLYLWYAKEISQGRFPTFRDGNSFVQPPLMSVIYAIPFVFFGASLSLIKIVNAVFAILTVFVTYKIGKQTNVFFGIFASCLLFLPLYFTHFSMLAYVEIPIAFFSALSIYALSRIKTSQDVWLAGIVLGLAFLTKFSGLVLIVSVIVSSIALFILGRHNLSKKWVKSACIALIFVAIWTVKNLIVYGNPYIYGLEFLFPTEVVTPDWIAEVSSQAAVQTDILGFMNVFGFPLFVVAVLGLTYFLFNLEELKILLPSLMLIVVFIALFIALSAQRGVDPRYLSILFPQVALFGGYWLYKLKEYRKWLVLLVIPFLIFALYTGITEAYRTARIVRYGEEWVNTLVWIKDSTPEDAVVYSLLCGSVNHYAERDCKWAGDNFPEVMRNGDINLIYESMKRWEIDYILLTRGQVSNDIIVPGSNFIGMYTFAFVRTIATDERFVPVYQSQNDAVIAVV